MTVGQLRHALNALPLEAESWQIGVLDADQGDAYSPESITIDWSEDRVWIEARFMEGS